MTEVRRAIASTASHLVKRMAAIWTDWARRGTPPPWQSYSRSSPSHALHRRPAPSRTRLHSAQLSSPAPGFWYRTLTVPPFSVRLPSLHPCSHPGYERTLGYGQGAIPKAGRG